MTSIIDTLGRTLNFNYDTNFRLQSITQLRNGQTHVWATFGYTAVTIVTNFTVASGPGPVVLGLPQNHIVSVLSQVGLEDGSKYSFEYTTWGQVYRIKHFAGGFGSFSAPQLTMAYSTTVTDPDEFSSLARYNYNLGAVMRRQDPKAALQTREYDSAGRVKKVTKHNQ